RPPVERADQPLAVRAALDVVQSFAHPITIANVGGGIPASVPTAAGERVRISVNRRPVAELVPLERPRWSSGAATERILREARAGTALLDDLAEVACTGA